MLNRATIAAAALDLIDRDGLDALSMRRLGRALGVEAMALYHHFPSKGDLLDEVVAAVAPAPAPPSGDWRADLAALAVQYRGMVGDHPNLLPVLISRPQRHPRAVAALQAQYAALRLAGLDGVALLDVHRTWGSYVIGYVVVEQQARSAGFADADWRPADDPLDAYQAARDWDEQFLVGLRLVLDAVA
jgi:AcrR family transcriptional regulator